MRAAPVFREKRIVVNKNSEDVAIVEIKVWEIQKSKDYPEGRKFSLFLTSGGKIIVGMDNHKPKGPHLHIGVSELSYRYFDDETLLSDFWDFVRKAGFEP